MQHDVNIDDSASGSSCGYYDVMFSPAFSIPEAPRRDGARNARCSFQWRVRGMRLNDISTSIPCRCLIISSICCASSAEACKARAWQFCAREWQRYQMRLEGHGEEAHERCAYRFAFLSRDVFNDTPLQVNHLAVKVWFCLVFRCRVMTGSVVSSIYYRVEGHRICAGTFAAVYASSQSTFNRIICNVLRGDK
eukprot:1714297-Pleurochrysis_carterae.AAC.1